MLHLSYLASEETLYSKVRWVSSVKVSVRVLVELLFALLPDMSTSPPSLVPTFHAVVPVPGFAETGSPSKYASTLLPVFLAPRLTAEVTMSGVTVYVSAAHTLVGTRLNSMTSVSNSETTRFFML